MTLLSRSPLLRLSLWVLVASATAVAEEPTAVESTFDEIAALQGGAPDARVRLFLDNSESWVARWSTIEKAQRSIDCTYFIFADDPWGDALLGLLYKKAKEGVYLRLMLDGRGSRNRTGYFAGHDTLQELAALMNVEIKVYNPLVRSLGALPDVKEVIASNHDKLLIVDDEWLITGGRNIGREYLVDTVDDRKAFRDTDVLVHGAHVAGQARRAFEEEFQKDTARRVTKDFFGNWSSQADELESDRRTMQRFLLDPKRSRKRDLLVAQHELWGDEKLPVLSDYSSYSTFVPFRGERAYPVLLLDKHSRILDGRDDITANIRRLVDIATEEILIQNPYVVLTEQAREGLEAAGRRGVKTTILTNSLASADTILAQLPLLYEWKEMVRNIPNLRIFAYDGPSHMHAKTFVFDRKVTVIGSYNLDPLSEEINSESVMMIKARAFARRCALIFEKDCESALEYKILVDERGREVEVQGPADHVGRKLLQKAKESEWLKFLRPLL